MSNGTIAIPACWRVSPILVRIDADAIPACWRVSPILVRIDADAIPVTGRTYRGLGVFALQPASGRTPPLWSVVHLKSGTQAVAVRAPIERAHAVATDVAEVGDWTAEDPMAADPDLRTRVQAVFEMHGLGDQVGAAA